MHTQTSYFAKADEALQQALNTAPTEEVLRVILLLDAIRPAPKPVKPDPRDYPSGTAWRKVIIERRREWVERELGPTLKLLDELGLQPRGGFLGQVVVDGTPRQLLQALQLDGVKSAILDFDVPILDLDDPREMRGKPQPRWMHRPTPMSKGTGRAEDRGGRRKVRACQVDTCDTATTRTTQMLKQIANSPTLQAAASHRVPFSEK